MGLIEEFTGFFDTAADPGKQCGTAACGQSFTDLADKRRFIADFGRRHDDIHDVVVNHHRERILGA